MNKHFELNLSKGFDYEWNLYRSKNLNLKYTNEMIQNSYVKKIAKLFDNTYLAISKILEINQTPKITVYLSNDILNNLKIPWDSSIPYLSVAFFNLRKPLKSLKILITHEIVHLLCYYWDKKIYHVELLEEGLACYLSDRKKNYHHIFLNSIINSLKKSIKYDFSLYVSDKVTNTDYNKAASFVKYLIEKYGMYKFKELFLRSVISCDQGIYKINNKVIPKTILYNLIGKTYDCDPIKIQIDWLNEVYNQGKSFPL